MTKSTAGLDFDAKPPTAEITISRKEAVMAPGFENGQTPPVMASFQPSAGLGGGFKNYVLGVDQTFAGGDAAVAMAKLYDRPTAPQDIDPYDSKLELSKAPKYRNIFQRIAKPGEVKPFIFGTDTMLGLKVAWSGVGGQFPDTLKAGFNRKEFAWAPLSMTEKLEGGKTTYYVKLPSFLATIDSKNSTDTNNAGIQALQYFATGTAATHLTLQPAVRQAMLARLDPNQQKLAEKWQENLADKDGLAHITILRTLYGNIPSTPAASTLLAELDHLDVETILPADFEFFETTSSPAGGTLLIKKKFARKSNVTDFWNFLDAYAALDNSVQKIKIALADTNITVEIPPEENRAKYLTEEFDKQLSMRAKLRRALNAVDPFGRMTAFLAE